MRQEGRQGAGAAGVTVSSGDIARLAHVGKAAVSNWRRRFGDFPEPVAGTATSPRFLLSQVEDWMARHGRRFQVSPVDRVWQQMRSTAEDRRLGDMVGTVGATLVLARRDPERWAVLARSVGSAESVESEELAGRPDLAVAGALGRALAEVVPELPGDGPEIDPDWLSAISAAVELAAGPERGGSPAEVAGEVFEAICDRYLPTRTRRAPVTPSEIAELMVDLAGITQGGAPGLGVFDPACGTGTLLLAAARAATGASGAADSSASRAAEGAARTV
ncbi:MAG TPA: N-6 DNA methylase, partial [Mycobacteriales bacterium]